MASKVKPGSNAGSTQANNAPQKRKRLPHPVSEQQIRERAYEIYLQRGEQPGNEVQDWLQAERELNRTTQRNTV